MMPTDDAINAHQWKSKCQNNALAGSKVLYPEKHVFSIDGIIGENH